MESASRLDLLPFLAFAPHSSGGILALSEVKERTLELDWYLLSGCFHLGRWLLLWSGQGDGDGPFWDQWCIWHLGDLAHAGT